MGHMALSELASVHLSDHFPLYHVSAMVHGAGSAIVTSQLCVRCPHVGKLKSSSVGIFTPQKSANIMNRGDSLVESSR